MVVLTCVDVIGAKLFRLPVFGALDVMMLAQLIAVSCAVAMGLLLDRHVQVEFFMVFFPERIQALVDAFVQLLCLGLFGIIVWRLFVYGYSLQTGGEETATAHIPLYPFTYAAALAIVPVCLALLQQMITSILRAVKK